MPAQASGCQRNGQIDTCYDHHHHHPCHHYHHHHHHIDWHCHHCYHLSQPKVWRYTNPNQCIADQHLTWQTEFSGQTCEPKFQLNLSNLWLRTDHQCKAILGHGGPVAAAAQKCQIHISIPSSAILDPIRFLANSNNRRCLRPPHHTGGGPYQQPSCQLRFRIDISLSSSKSDSIPRPSCQAILQDAQSKLLL